MEMLCFIVIEIMNHSTSLMYRALSPLFWVTVTPKCSSLQFKTLSIIYGVSSSQPVGLPDEENTTAVNGSHVQLNAPCQGGGWMWRSKIPPKCAIIPLSNCIGGQERDREGKESSYTRPTIGDRDRTVGMRRAQAVARHCDTTASLKPETGKKMQRRRRRSQSRPRRRAGDLFHLNVRPCTKVP